MIGNAVWLVVAMLATMGGLFWFIIGAKGKWWAKSIMLLASAYLAMAAWFATIDMQGWPTQAPVPTKFEIHWILVDEAGGSIYVMASAVEGPDDDDQWIISLYETPTNAPRLYDTAYSQEAHENADKIQKLIKAGKRVVAKGQPGHEPGGEGEGEGADGDRSHRHGFNYEVTEFYVLPPALPPKENTIKSP